MIRRGKGLCTTIHSTGLSGGNDPSDAIVHMNGDGSVNVAIGAVDLGQGIRTIARQITADVLQLDPNLVTVFSGDTNTNTFDCGQFASRTTLITGNAIKIAAENLLKIIKANAARTWQVDESKIKFEDGLLSVPGEAEKTLDITCASSQAQPGEALTAVGRYMPVFPPRDNETGAADFFEAVQFASCVAKVAVDDETGEVEVEKIWIAVEAGVPINPALIEAQAHGGASFGVGTALSEDIFPYYPSQEFMRTGFSQYHIPTALDMPRVEVVHVSCPSSFGPFGAKGVGEVVANCVAPAIINAISDALGGVFFPEVPVTPERVLKALGKA